MKLKLYHDIFDRQLPPLEQAEFVAEQQDDAASWHRVGLARFQKLHFSEAVAAFDEALRRDPAAWPIALDRAMGLTIMGKFREALADLDQVLQAAPHHFGAHYNRGRLLARLNENEAALAALQTAARLDQGLALALRVPQAIRTLSRRLAGRPATPFDYLRDWLDERRAGLRAN